MSGISIGQLAALCGGEVEGNGDQLIGGANSLEDATPSDVSFVGNRKAAEQAASSQAGCLLVPADFAKPANGSWSLIRVSNPRAAFARVLKALYPPRARTAFTHPTALIAASAKIGGECSIGAYVTIGENARVEDGCSIDNGCHIGDNVSLGPACQLKAHVTVYDGVRIGARVILHSGCVLGADGFGFAMAGDHYEKFPQVGTVELGDDVEIGANACVDRAALGVTRIGRGTKLDNLVHIAHNCTLGEHVVVAAQTGLSGGVTVGDYAVIGGQVGIGDKARIDAKAIVGSKAGVLTGQRVAAGEPLWGIPARPLRQHLKGLAHVARLTEYRTELSAVKQKVAVLEQRREENESK